MKSEKYQEDKVMITQLVVYWILLISTKKKKRLIAADLSKQNVLDPDSRETILQFPKGTTSSVINING